MLREGLGRGDLQPFFLPFKTFVKAYLDGGSPNVASKVPVYTAKTKP